MTRSREVIGGIVSRLLPWMRSHQPSSASIELPTAQREEAPRYDNIHVEEFPAGILLKEAAVSQALGMMIDQPENGLDSQFSRLVDEGVVKPRVIESPYPGMAIFFRGTHQPSVDKIANTLEGERGLAKAQVSVSIAPTVEDSREEYKVDCNSVIGCLNKVPKCAQVLDGKIGEDVARLILPSKRFGLESPERLSFVLASGIEVVVALTDLVRSIDRWQGNSSWTKADKTTRPPGKIYNVKGFQIVLLPPNGFGPERLPAFRETKEEMRRLKGQIADAFDHRAT